MSLQNMSKSAVRVGKNYIKGYSDVQVKVRDATSNDPWGPSGTQMNELAQLSYNQNEFVEMMEILDKRLNDKGKNWRHVFKALTVLDYLLHAGSENVVIYFRDNIYVVKTLKEFQYVDEYGKDQGANVRQKAKDITNLLQDESRLREERRSRATMRDRMSGPRETGEFEDDEGRRRRQAEEERRRRRRNNEDEELKRAIEESKRMAREEQDKIRAEAKDEEELNKALELSRQEEEKRIRELEEANKNALFEDGLQLDGPNAYANQQQVDFFGNPLVDTSVNPYGQQLQPQYTSFNPYMQQQQTGYNPFLQQQMQEQQMMEQQYMMQQQQQQQQAEYQRQLELQQAAQQYQQMMTHPQQQQPLQPQPTSFGSNNPFALFSQPQQQQQQQQLPPQPQAQHNVPVGDLFGSSTPPPQQQIAPSPAPQPTVSPAERQQGPPRVRVANDPQHAKLNQLLASGEGIDTFGNVGDLRMGPNASRLQAQRTGATAFGQQAFGNGNGTNGQQGAGGQQQQGDATNSSNPFFTL